MKTTVIRDAVKKEPWRGKETVSKCAPSITVGAGDSPGAGRTPNTAKGVPLFMPVAVLSIGPSMIAVAIRREIWPVAIQYTTARAASPSPNGAGKSAKRGSAWICAVYPSRSRASLRKPAASRLPFEPARRPDRQKLRNCVLRSWGSVS